MSVNLDHVAPWGRSLDEYQLMFGLTPADLRGQILGCGDGPASFNAEATAMGCRVISCDPLYILPASAIRERFERSVEPIMSQVRTRPDNYVWTYHHDPDELLTRRRAATSAFLADFESGGRDGRYVTAALPALPFAEGQFDLAVCSHLLFLYSRLLSLSFHVKAIMELCRVSREVRVFPLVDLNCRPSPHLADVAARLEHAGHRVDVLQTTYQFQRNGNQMMRIRALQNCP